jgi:hypothetical protein
LLRDKVVPESPIEKHIQEYNPAFKGTAPDGRRLADPTTVRPTALAPVDVAQFVDMNEHPIEKSLVENAQNLISPESMSIIAAGGGSALFKNAKAITTINKMVAAGWSAQAIAGTIENSKAAYDAFENGDGNAALYHLTNAGVSTLMAVPGIYGVAGKEMPLVSKGDIDFANKVIDVGSKTVSAVAKIPSAVAEHTLSAATRAGLIKPESTAAIVQSLKPQAKSIDKFRSDWETAVGDLQAQDKNVPIKTIGDLKEALPQIKDGIWNNEVEPVVAEHAN